jgi:histidyl-tRNA synthetase
VEVCSAVSEVLLTLGFKNFTIHVNHRQLLKALIKAAGISLDNESTTLVAVDKLDKIGMEGVEKELVDRGINTDQIKKLVELIKRPENSSESAEIERLKLALSGSEEANKAIEDLTKLCKLLDESPVAGRYSIDATLARGLGYYTGPIFEIRSSDFGGSLGGGGRYDGLIGMFKGSEIPAVGFSIGFERLILILEEKGLFGKLAMGPDVMLCHFSDVEEAAVIKAANAMRNGGIKVEVYPETPKIGKQISYAESVGAKFVAILGANEANTESVSLKNLETGEQQSIKYADVASIVLK